jgi:hypothetical protein
MIFPPARGLHRDDVQEPVSGDHRRDAASSAAELAKRRAIDKVYARLAEIRRHASPRPSITPPSTRAAIDLPEQPER